MKENLKLLHLANHIHHGLFQDDIVIGGFYNWHRVFHYPNNFVCWDKHTPKKIKEDNPDIILIGLSRPEILSMLPEEINRAIKSGQGIVTDPLQISRMGANKTVLSHHSDNNLRTLPRRLSEIQSVIDDVMETRPLKVFHIDYAVQMWKQVDSFSPGYMKHVLEQADILFTADISQGNAMYALLGGKKDIYFISHPTNIIPLKSIANKHTTKSPLIRAIIHRYDNEWYMPYLVDFPLREIDAAYKYIMLLLDGDPNNVTNLKSNGVDFVETGKRHTEWLHTLVDTFACVCSYHWFTNYGRSSVECAALKTPMVGSESTYLQNILFPELTSERGYVDDQAEMLLKLMTDPKFYKECQDYAFDKVEDVSYDSSKRKFLEMVNGEMEPRWKAGRYDKYKELVDKKEPMVKELPVEQPIQQPSNRAMRRKPKKGRIRRKLKKGRK